MDAAPRLKRLSRFATHTILALALFATGCGTVRNTNTARSGTEQILLTGSFIVERLFSISGIGRYFVQSISDRDYTMIMGITIFFGVFVVVCNLLVDILLAVVDPRVKLTGK